MPKRIIIQVVANEGLKNRIEKLIERTGHTQSKQTKLLIEKALITEEKLYNLTK